MHRSRPWISMGLSMAIALIAFPAKAEKVEITLLQLNDVYEITPVSGGKFGGLARVATLRKQLRRQNPNVLTLLGGDCLSPSALGTARLSGEPLAGQQMVAVLNTMGLDVATFGNHEFDLKEGQFRKRLQESEFNWISSNVTDEKGQPFDGVARSQILSFKGKEGSTVRVGVVGVTLGSNPARYVRYTNPLEAMRQEVDYLKPQVDIIVALTHLSLAQDQQLAESIPEIDLILGGHEHENHQQYRGADFTPIYKADANARSVYVHQLQYDTDLDQLQVESKLVPITEDVAEDAKTAATVKRWVERGYRAFRENGFEPEAIVAEVPEALDGMESTVRNRPSRLTQLIADSFLNAAAGAEVAIFNGGSIRIDDVLPPGPITQYDVIRILPFGGQIQQVEMSGQLLQKVLTQGLANQGTGGYLQTAGVSFDGATQRWMLQGQPLQPNQIYKVAMNDFLLTGKETGLAFLNPENPDLRIISAHGDVRFALIEELRSFGLK